MEGMTEATKPWRAEMPKESWTRRDGITGALRFLYSQESVADLVLRANAELDALRAQLAERDERIRELTEWRPMSEAPEYWFIGECFGGEVEIVKRFPSGKFCDRDFRIRDVIGCLPLPESKP
jgi:hypothetical protein